MKTRMMRKIAVLVTGSALALSFPVASSFAGQPSGPHGQGKACQNISKRNGGPQHFQPQSSNGIGWKCGLNR